MPKVLTPDHDRAGYLVVDLRNERNKKYHKFVHQLVALVYIPNPNHYKYVNHKDRDKENCFVGNLEWCTKAINNAHTFTVGSRMKGKRYCLCFKGSPVIDFNSIIRIIQMAEYAASNCGFTKSQALKFQKIGDIQPQLLEAKCTTYHLYAGTTCIFSSSIAKECYSYANQLYGTHINHKKPYSCKYRLYVCKNDEDPYSWIWNYFGIIIIIRKKS